MPLRQTEEGIELGKGYEGGKGDENEGSEGVDNRGMKGTSCALHYV